MEESREQAHETFEFPSVLIIKPANSEPWERLPLACCSQSLNAAQKGNVGAESLAFESGRPGSDPAKWSVPCKLCLLLFFTPDSAIVLQSH